MAYKKYIKRGEKVYGPYIYHSRKVNGKVISEYRGKASKKKSNKILIFLIIALITAFLLFATLNYNKVNFEEGIKITKTIFNSISSSLTKSLTGLITSEDINESEKAEETDGDTGTSDSEEEEIKDEPANETTSQPGNITGEEPINETIITENETEAINETSINETLNETFVEENETEQTTQNYSIETNFTEQNITINETVNETTQTIEITKNITNATVPEFNVTETNATNITIENITQANITIQTIQYQAVLGQPVKWKKQITSEAIGKIKIPLPKEAENISVNKIKENEETEVSASITGAIIGTPKGFLAGFLEKILGALTGRVTDSEQIENEQESEIEIEVDDIDAEYKIEYFTDAPYAVEETLKTGKRVKIIGPENLHYENVLSFTNLDESLHIINPSGVKIYWIEENKYISIQRIEDKNSNGVYDYIEWTAPVLSNQTFEIIVITKAEHLDENRTFISDIYEEVRALDDIWSETINNKEYVRVTFERNLTSENDITLYPRVTSGNPRIEVYEVDENEIIATFDSLTSNEYNKVYLTNLQGEQDSFDLKVLDGSVEFDHIIDPYNDTVMSFNPDFRWLLDGDETASVGGSGMNSDGGNDPSWVSNIIPEGEASQCGDYDGSVDETLIPNHADINSGTTTLKSISVWFEADTIDTSGNGRLIWSEGGGTNGFALYVYDVGGEDRLYGLVYESANIDYCYTTISTGTLYHAGLTLDTAAGELILYVNGVELASDTSLTIGADFAAHSAGVAIGGVDSALDNHDDADLDGFFDGRISDMVYYAEQAVLTQEDFAAIYNAGVGAEDTEYPQFSDYWDDNATLIGSGTGNFNVTVTSTNGTVLLEINNTNVTATNLTADVYNASYYFTSNGTYSYKWHSWGNGTSTNYNVSNIQSYTVTTDTSPPEVTINSPQNITYYSLLDFPLTLNVSLNEHGSVMYTLDSGATNTSMNTTDNQNFNATLDTLDDGEYTFQVYANDTTGNNNYTESVVFTVATENVVIDGTVKDSLGDTINSTVVILYSENSTVLYNETEEIHDETTIPITELYDIEVVPLEIDSISIIEFTEVNLSEFVGDSINLVQVDEIIDDPDFEIIHVVNPIINDFANATMTFLPAAKRLYKCQDWNFTERTCDGDWELLSNKVNITQENTVELEPNATAYGEIPIINALHLDSDRNFISNIFEQVRYLDENWSETIPSGDYVRVTFLVNLTSANDITLYPRTVSGTPFIEIYEINESTLIANFTSINDNQYNTVYLTSLVGSQNMFDLHVVGGSVEFDHIVDPSFAARTEQYAQGSSLTGNFDFTVNKPTGTVDGDIMFMFLSIYVTTPATIDSVPAGWTQVATNTVGLNRWYLYYKIASSEGASYTWSLSKSCKYLAVNTAYSAGDFDVQSIDDITVSNTLYGTAGTAVRAASINVPNANSPLVFFGSVYNTASKIFDKPSVPTTDWVEDFDYGHTVPDLWSTIDSMIWTGSGNTGNMDATCSASITTNKHAFAVALNPAAPDTEYPQFSSLTETPTDPATYSYGQNYQFNATITLTNGTAGIQFNGVNHTATNSSNIFSVTISNLAANTGGYNYYWWAFGNGTNNNFNSTTTQTYTINKAVPQGSISGTSPITYGTAGDVQGTESNSGDGDVQYKLYRDSIEVSNPDNSVLGVGTYNYVYNATSGTNYTANASIGTFSLTVNQAVPQTSLTFDKASPQTYGTEIIPTCSIITGQGSAVLTMDGNVITSGNPLTLGVDTYTFNCSLAESQNYTYSENVSDFTINQAVGQVNGLINNTQANFTAKNGTDNKNIYLNATVNSPCMGTGSIIVNGTTYNSGTLPLYNITNLSIGFYNATFNYDGNINYSSDTEVWWINIYAAVSNPSFGRILNCDGCGQHKAPPLTNITMILQLNFNGTANNEELFDLYPNNWTVIDDNGGNISSYNNTYNKINWTVNGSGYIEKNYTIKSPQLIIPSKKYYFYSGLAGYNSNPWMVIVADPVGSSEINLTITEAYTNNVAFAQADIDAINATGGTTSGLDKNEHWDIDFSTVSTSAIYSVSIKYYVSGTTSGPWSIAATDGRDGTPLCTKTGEQGASITTQQSLACPNVDTQAELDNLWVLMTGEVHAGPETITVDHVFVYVDYDAPADNPPKYYNPSVNNTNPLPNVVVRHNVNWTDDNTLSYATLEVNSSGASCNTVANVSSTALSGASSWANLTWQVPNACEGKTIGWKQYANDSLNQWNSSMPLQTYTVQNVAPIASFGTNPVDNYNSTSQLVTFNLSCSDNLGVSTLQLWGNWTGTWHANQTNSTPINNTVWSVQVNGIPEGKGHTWGVWCNDTLNNGDWTDTNRTFTVDFTGPSLSNQGSNTTEINQNEYFCLNITATDSIAGVDKVYAEVWNTTNWLNYTMSEDGTSCDGTPTDGVYGVKIQGTAVGLWNYSKAHANDTLNNWNSYDFSDLTINVTTPPDPYYPQFSNFQEYLANNSDYSYGQNYQFNSTVTNTNGTVFLSFDNTNYSASNDTATNFYVDFTSLSAGNYNYYWGGYGNGTNKNYNQSSVRVYVVQKATPTGTLTNNETWTEIYPTPVTIGLSESNNGDSDVVYKVWRDNVDKGSGETVLLGYGTYNYVLNTTGGTNYTANASMDAQTLTINQNIGSCSILFNYSSPVTYPTTFLVWSNCTTSATLYRNGTTISNNSEQVLAASAYNFTVIRTDSQNYTNYYDEETFVVQKATGEVATYIDNTRNNKSALLYTEKWLNATLINGQTGSTIKLYYNNTLINQGASPLSNLTNFTGTGIWNVSGIYDGNENYTSDIETWWVTVSEDSPPTINIVYPENTTYNTDVTQLNYTVEDDIALDKCWYSKNGGVTNTTITCGNNVTGLTANEGSNNWTVYANDSIGQGSSDIVFFTKDTTYPQFSNYQRAPATPNEDQNIQVNVTITETNLDTVILEWNATTNYTVSTNVSNEYYFTILQGNYTAHDSVTYYWYANDAAGNMNKSSQQGFTVTNQIPSVSSPGLNDTTPKTNDLISCNGGTFSDNDAGDTEQVRYFKWYDTNVEISGQTSQTLSLTVSGLDKGDVIKCSVRVFDGYDNSSWTNSSNTATIQNSPPTITNPQTTINKDADGTPYNYDYEATDADSGDSLTWYDNTTLFDINSATGVISDTPTESEAGSYEIRISVSDGTVNATDDFTYTINDVTSPSINFQPPTEENDSQLTRNYIQVNVTASDVKGIGIITLKLYNSTSLVQTNISSTSPLFVNFTNLPDENYYFNATVNDTSGNTNQTETRTVSTDTGPPTINYVSPTENSGVYRNRNYIEVNVTASDPNLDKIVIRLYNSAHAQINSATTSTSPNFANFTGLSNGLYYYNATANDTFGNDNSLSTRNITLDTTKPSITNLIESPTDPAIWTSGATYQFNSTITDTNLGTVLIEFDGANYTPTKTGNVYNLTLNNLAADTYNYYWYANDSAGNINQTATQTYTVNQNSEACNVLFNETSSVNYGTLFKVFSDCSSDFTLKRNETTISNNSVQNLAAGIWNFTVQRADTQNYSNIYDEELFTINKAAGNVTLLINGSAQNQAGIYGIQTNASASTLYGTLTLYRNQTDITSKNNVYITLAVGYYNYTAFSSGDQNHSSTSITRFVDISKAQSGVNLTLNGTQGNVTITQDSSIWLNLSTISGDSGATLKLYKNSSLINQGTSPLNNLTAFNVVGLFNITGIYLQSENFTGSYETWWVNVTETPDTENPSVTSLIESPTDPATYSQGQIYRFNATITDNRDIHTALIDFNGTNYTATNLVGNIYNFTISDLLVGTYNYRWYANDTSGNSNNTENGTYTINQATPPLSLTITPSNTVTYPTQTTANGTGCPSQLTCNLYRDNIQKTNPEIATLGFGTYNYTYNTTGNTNYTFYTNTTNLTINQNTGACDVLFNETSPITYPTAFKVWTNCNSAFTLYRNGTSITNNSVQSLAVSSYNFTVIRADIQNYSNYYDEEQFIIQKATGVVYTYINNSRANKTIEQYTEIYINGTLVNGTGNIKLYNNGTLINQGTSPLSNFTNFTTIGLYNITTIYDGNENYTSAYETWWLNVSEADVTPPQISIIYPENTSYNSVQTQLNYSASDNFGLNSCWYSLNKGVTNTTINCNVNVTGLNSGQGSSTWTIWANDAKGNLNSSSVTFFVDSINPTISFVSPTETNNTFLGRNYIQVNVTANDTNPDTIIIKLYNSTNLLQTNTSTTSPFFINYTGLSAGTYFFNATVNDSVNNQNSTQTRNISLVIPTLTITKPKNATYITKENLPLEYSADYEDYVWYNLNLSGNNITIPSNTTFNVSSEGSHTLYLYANNSNGETVKNVTFTIDSNKFKVHYGNYKWAAKGGSIDFNKSSYEELENLSGIVLENTDYGKIEFNEPINLTDDENVSDNEVDLDIHTNISFNRIEVNSTALPNFNKSATLYLYNLTFTNPRILRNNETCPSTICTKISYDATVGTLKFNVTQFTVYSAEETPVEAAPSVGPEVGVGPKTPVQCLNNTDCERGEICWNYRCVKLFDVKIINFESPIELGSFFEFTYSIKGMAKINDDVKVNFWIENQAGERITSGSDTIYLGSFEEKTETTKIFLPTNVKSGIYEFYVEVVHQAYQAKSHRTIEIQVKEGIATIRFREVQELKIYASIIIALLSIIIIFLIIRSLRKKQPLAQEKIIKEIPREKEQLKLYIKPKVMGYAQKKGGVGGTLRKIFEIFRNLIGILSLRISNLYQNLKKRGEELRLQRQRQTYQEKPRKTLVEKEFSINDLLLKIKIVFLRVIYEIKLAFVRLWRILKKKEKKTSEKNKQYSRKKEEKTAEKLIREINKNDENKKEFEKDIISDIVDKEKQNKQKGKDYFNNL